MLFFLCLFFSLFLGSGISAIIVMHCIKKSNAYGENEGTFEQIAIWKFFAKKIPGILFNRIK